MRVALLQYEIVWADVEENLRRWEERIRGLKGQADVALLPEMCTTGFCTDRPDLAEGPDGQTLRRLQAVAEEADVMVVGSYMGRPLPASSEGEVKDGRVLNRGFLLRPGMAPVFVDKKHLYKHGGEHLLFAPGEQQTLVEWRGAKFRYVICYDLRFPTWCRMRKEDPYDILLVSANWPAIRIHYWDVLVPARAIENQSYIAAVNCVGTDGTGLEYNGHSVAYDTRLMPLAKPEDGKEGTCIATFDIDKLRHFREVLPIWKDAD